MPASRKRKLSNQWNPQPFKRARYETIPLIPVIVIQDMVQASPQSSRPISI